MTVKELLQGEPYPDTPVGIYELSEDNKPEPLLLGDRLAAIGSRYAAREIEDNFEAYYEPAQRTGIVIYIKKRGAPFMNKNEAIKELLSRCLRSKTPFTYGHNTKSIMRRVLEYYRRRKTVKRVNNALGIALRKWQIHYIFDNQSTPLFIEISRGGGKTTAHILFILLNPLMDGIELERVATNPPQQGLMYDSRGYAKVLYGEDGAAMHRQAYFKHELMKTRDKLNAAGIKTNNLTIRR